MISHYYFTHPKTLELLRVHASVCEARIEPPTTPMSNCGNGHKHN
jgi:hypothetical protein